MQYTETPLEWKETLHGCSVFLEARKENNDSFEFDRIDSKTNDLVEPAGEDEDISDL